MEPLYKTLNLSFDLEGLEQALERIDIGEGTHANPIPLDLFVLTDLKGIYNISRGEGFCLELRKIVESSEISMLNIQLCYLKMNNLTKGRVSFMQKEDWNTIFDIEENDEITFVAPDGCLFLTPIINNEDQTFKIKTKETFSFDGLKEDIFISYNVVLSLLYNSKIYYLRIDPLIKISSGH